MSVSFTAFSYLELRYTCHDILVTLVIPLVDNYYSFAVFYNPQKSYCKKKKEKSTLQKFIPLSKLYTKIHLLRVMYKVSGMFAS